MSFSPPIVALTGGIGSGKSAVATLFESWGAVVVDADVLSREAVIPGAEGLTRIRETFGPEVLKSDGTLDRRSLGHIVFADPAKRSALEGILHPLVRSAWLKSLALLRAQSEKNGKRWDFILYVVPLLFESGVEYSEIERIVLITSDVEPRLKRIVARDHLSESEARRRILAQYQDDVKIPRSDYVISNNGTLGELESAARVVFDKLKTQP